MLGDNWRAARAAIACVMAVWLAGCGRTRPQTEPDLPPLAAPLPPPRVLPPLEGGPIEGVPTADEPPRQAPAPRLAGARPPRTARRRRRPLSPVAETPPPVETPPTDRRARAAVGSARRRSPCAGGRQAAAEASRRRSLARGLPGARVRRPCAVRTAKRFALLAEQALRAPEPGLRADARRQGCGHCRGARALGGAPRRRVPPALLSTLPSESCPGCGVLVWCSADHVSHSLPAQD